MGKSKKNGDNGLLLLACLWEAESFRISAFSLMACSTWHREKNATSVKGGGSVDEPEAKFLAHQGLHGIFWETRSSHMFQWEDGMASWESMVQRGSSTTSRKDRRSSFISEASSSAFGLYQTLHSKGQHKDWHAWLRVFPWCPADLPIPQAFTSPLVTVWIRKRHYQGILLPPVRKLS